MQDVGYILYNDEPAALTGNTTDTVGHSKGVIGWTEVSMSRGLGLAPVYLPNKYKIIITVRSRSVNLIVQSIFNFLKKIKMDVFL